MFPKIPKRVACMRTIQPFYWEAVLKRLKYAQHISNSEAVQEFQYAFIQNWNAAEL